MPATGQWIYLGMSPSSEGVWSFHDGGGPPSQLVGDISSFTSEGHYDRHPYVRVAGNHRNASLLLHLHSLRQRDEIDRLEVCSPNLGGNRAQQADMLQSLQILAEQFGLSSSLGGWREFSNSDNCVFSLIRLRDGGQSASSSIIGFLRAHVVWPFWSFMSGADPYALAGILAEVVDPRFFCDSHSPESMHTRLEKYLGYSPTSGPRQGLLRKAVGLSASIEDKARVAELPGGFIARKFFDGGLHAATRLAIAYLGETWRASLHRDWQRLFVARYFFEGDAAAQGGFQAHMRLISSMRR